MNNHNEHSEHLLEEEVTPNNPMLGHVAYLRYKKNKYSAHRHASRANDFLLKLAIINENPDAQKELLAFAQAYEKRGDYVKAHQYYKKRYFADKKLLKISENMMLYSAVEKNDINNANFMLQKGADITIKTSEHSIGPYAHPDLCDIPSIMPENSLLHIACYKNNPLMVKLLLTAGAPAFVQNRFKKMPREVNQVCFDTAWLLMHYENLYKIFLYASHAEEFTPDILFHITNILIKKTLNFSIFVYLNLTNNAARCLILEEIHDKYSELLEKDEESKYIVCSNYPTNPTIREIITHAFKNVNPIYSKSIGLFREENRALRALKALNYITWDNKLCKDAPLKFKEEFEKIYSTCPISSVKK